MKEVIAEEKRFYDYYHAVAKAGVKGTKWEEGDKELMEIFSNIGLDFKGRRVLDISGGPGFLTQRLAEYADEVICTEYSQFAVEGMKDALGINCVKYDYNSDEILSSVSGTFDIILVIYSIGFCNDVRKFAAELAKISRKGTVICIMHSPPTLGLNVRWQFDEYTYNRCWHLEYLSKAFAEVGFLETKRDFELRKSYAYDLNWYTSKKFLHRLAYSPMRIIGRLYKSRILWNRSKSINRELIQKDVVHLFSKT